jgi:hypothetical protein
MLNSHVIRMYVELVILSLVAQSMQKGKTT